MQCGKLKPLLTAEAVDRQHAVMGKSTKIKLTCKRAID